MQKTHNSWLRIKKYPHIGLPPPNAALQKWIASYVLDPKKVSQHSFLPFIHKTKRERRFRKEYCSKTGDLLYTTVKGKKKSRKRKLKPRELFYASHIDSIIYSYYASIIQDKYEMELAEKKLGEYITAYRTIPVDSKIVDGPNKCNIHFAKEVFDEIKRRPEKDFSVLALDIKGFFDNLDHRKLREKLILLLHGTQSKKLREDYFNIFKSLTRYTYVDLIDLFELFKERIFVNSTKSGKKAIFRTGIKRSKFLNEKKAVAFCTKEEYFQNKNKLLKQSKYFTNSDGSKEIKTFGIPQGSPLSCVLANLYMLEFDETMSKLIKKENGFYRRYSDDIVIVLPNNKYGPIIKEVNQEIEKIKLEIKSSKTQIFKFWRSVNDQLICGQQFKTKLNLNKNLKYLGFEFDGQTTRIKSSSISNFHRKMKRAVARGTYHALNPYSKTFGEIFKNRLYKKFSYKGAERKVKWAFNQETERYEPTTLYDWGNFLSYAYKSAKIMESPVIKKQTKKSWKQLNDLLKEAKLRLITYDKE